MNKIPISIIIDDPAPLVHIYREHRAGGPVLPNGEALLPEIPTDFLERFCDTVEEFGICGKFSIVPMPGCRGDIVNGIEGYDIQEVRRWLDIARKRLTPYFDFCPEILTHHKALDLETGTFLSENEEQWASHQNRASLAAYISKALELMKEADVVPTGVTSPWCFGADVEEDYVAAICDAFYGVLGKKKSWYFLHKDTVNPNVRPFVKFREGDRCVVTVVRTVDDHLWQTISCQRWDEAYIESIADAYITKDGTAGQIIEALARNSYPILCTHWQALFSNGRETGLKILREVGRRVQEHYGDKIQWQSFSYLMDHAAEE